MSSNTLTISYSSTIHYWFSHHIDIFWYHLLLSQSLNIVSDYWINLLCIPWHSQDDQCKVKSALLSRNPCVAPSNAKMSLCEKVN